MGLPWWLSSKAKQETQARFLGQEDPLGKEMATHSSILAWEIPWTEKPGRLSSMESQELDMTQWLNNNKTVSSAHTRQGIVPVATTQTE